MTKPYDLYYWPTPNGWKVTILLEELGQPYKVKYVNIGKGEQFEDDFLKISPNNRMPAIIDYSPEGSVAPITIFESGAMMEYLAEKHGQFLPSDNRGKYEVLQWLYWQMANLGPNSGQNNHFKNYMAGESEYATTRFGNEVNRLYGVMDKRLSDREFLAGEYSIADMACIGWTVGWERQGQNIEDFPNLKRWISALRGRPMVKAGLEIGKEKRRQGGMSEEEKRILFGQRAR